MIPEQNRYKKQIENIYMIHGGLTNRDKETDLIPPPPKSLYYS